MRGFSGEQVFLSFPLSFSFFLRFPPRGQYSMGYVCVDGGRGLTVDVIIDFFLYSLIIRFVAESALIKQTWFRCSKSPQKRIFRHRRIKKDESFKRFQSHG